MLRQHWLIPVVVAGLLTGLAAIVLCAALGPRDVVLAAYATSLRGRSAAQRANARRAADAINGTILTPGKAFSFNHTVGPLSVDRGYLKAAVSYDGELVPNFGGGVCQTSTTLYNAALLAGMQIAERHRHFWPPKYAAPGADAAVAYPSCDLVIHNVLSQPVTLVGRVAGDLLIFEIRSRSKSSETWQVVRRLRSIEPAGRVRKQTAALPQGKSRLQVHGQDGFAVTTYRTMTRNGQVERQEIIAEDAYPPLNEVRQIGADQEDITP